MSTKNKCTGCKFFKNHVFFSKDSAQDVSCTCEVSGKTAKYIYPNVLDVDLKNYCPLEKSRRYDILKNSWKELTTYIKKLESESELLSDDCQRVLLDIVIKIVKLERGIEDESKQN